MLFDASVYSAGAAHPNSFSHSVNYDRVAQAPLQLAALFRANAPYLELIATYCRDELAGKAVLEFPEGVEPTAENFQNWNITDEGLRISFDPYQVAPYAWGPQQVLVPLDELGAIVLPEGLLGQSARR